MQALGAAYEKYGFVILQNHGVSDDLISRARDGSKKFFALGEEEKKKYHLAGLGGARGYTGFGVETAKGSTKYDLKEFWHLGRDLPPGHRYEDKMPPNVDVEEGDFTAVTKEIFAALDALGGRVLEALAVHLGQPREYFGDKVNEGNSILRVIHYPPLARDGEDGAIALANAGHVRAAAHEDINLITVLPYSSNPGLQLLTREGTWLDVTTPPDVMICDTGDMMSLLTGGRVPSTTHRVVNPANSDGGRLSMPFFMHPHPDAILEPIEGGGSPILAREFLHARLKEIGVA